MQLSLSALQLFAFLANTAPLPEQLPVNYLVDQSFLGFQEPAGTSTPLFSSLTVDGAPIGSPGTPTISDLFTDSTFAILPTGTSIQKSSDSSGREVWRYPVGTEVAHEIKFNDVSHQLYELRIIRKTSDSEWDFASYSPKPDATANEPILRNRYSGNAELVTTLQLSNGLSPKLDLKRINLNSCRRCHFMTSDASYQYPNLSSTGPCGFTPGNDVGIRPWIEKYKEKFGYSPFKN